MEVTMSIWTHFTGAFGIDGFIWEDDRWNTIRDEISKLILPLPGVIEGCADPVIYKINLNDSSSLHFADVMVSGDLEDVETLLVIEEWLLKIEKRLNEKEWSIRCGSFLAYVEYQAPAIYYYDDCGLSFQGWKKIKYADGVLLQEEDQV
jgi:hypothetical protein